MSKPHHAHDGTAELLRGRSIPKDRHVHFWDEKGEIHFGYREQYRGRELKFSCCVPKEVLERGTTAVRAHAATQVRAWRQKPRADADRFDAFAAHPDFPLATTHRGVTLKGRIISAANNTLRVRLERPYTGESFVEYRWASAMAGHHIFTRACEFSADAIANAKRLLVDIYEAARYRDTHRATIALAEELNRRSRRIP